MTGFLEVVLGAYGVNVKSVKQLRGGAKLLDLFSIPSTDSPHGNFRQLKDVLRTYFPQLESKLCLTKCARGDSVELCYVAALSVGALIAQDLSKASASSDQTLPERLRNLCAYQGAEVNSIKEFCEIVFKDDDVPTKVRTMLSSWIDHSENENSTSSGSSFNSSLASVHSSRTPLSPLNAVVRTPENRLRVREKYNQEVVKLRGDLLIMRERYDHLEADMKQQAEAKERELKELQNRVRVLRSLIEADSQQENRNNDSSIKTEISQGRLKMLQKQVQQLQEYEQKFFDEKLRAEQLETKLLQDEKKIKDLKVRIQTLEATIIERDEEISQAADEIGALRDRLDEQRVNNSFVRHRNQSQDTLDSLPGGENLGGAVQDLVLAEVKSDNDDLREQLESVKNELSAKNVEVADLHLSNQMRKEQIGELESQVETLRAQIRTHLETITQAANQANELSSKLEIAQSECERLQLELGTVTEVKQQLEERRKYLENKVQLLKAQIEKAQARFTDMDHIKSLVEEQLKSQLTLIEDLRAQIAEKTARILAVESELFKATTDFTETLKSMNLQLVDDRKSHSVERTKLERRVEVLEGELTASKLETKTLYVEIEKLKIERAEFHTQLNIHLESQSKAKKELLLIEKKLCLEEEMRNSFEISFKQAIEELKVLKSTHEKLKTEVEQRKESEGTLKQQLEQEQKSLEESQQSLKQLEEENRNLKKTYIGTCTKLQEVEDIHEHCSEKREHLKEANEKLKQSLNVQAEKISTMENSIGDLKESLSTETSDKQFMQQMLDEATETISENDIVIKALKENVTELEGTVGELSKEVNLKKLEAAESYKELAESRAHSDADKKTLLDQCQEGKRLLEEAQEQRKKVEEELQLAKEQFNNLKVSSEQLVQEKLTLETENERCESELQRLRIEIDDYQSKMEEVISANENYKAEVKKLQAEGESYQSKVQDLETKLGNCNHEIDLKSVKMTELEKIISKAEADLTTCEDSHKKQISEFSEEISSLKGKEEASKIQIGSLTEKSLKDETHIALLMERVVCLEKEGNDCKKKITDLERELESARCSLQEAVADNEQLRCTQKNDLANMQEIKEMCERETLDKGKLTIELDELRSEHAKVVAEIAELRQRTTNDPTAEVEKWKGFRKSLVDKLENFDVQAPVMNEDQLLGVIDKSLENQKKLKDLQVENQNLSRLVCNAEDNVKCRMMELTADNDLLKRKLRETSSELNRCTTELKEITATVIKAKAGDTVDGAILSPLSRDIMNIAVACQENSTTTEEVTKLRLSLNDIQRDKERLESEVDRLRRSRAELTSVKMERDHLKAENIKIKNDRRHDQSIDLMREGYDLEIERLRDELQRSNNELRKTREYVSSLLDKYDKTKESSLRKISGLHDYMYQNNIPLPKPRRKSPNQPGLPTLPRQSDPYSEDFDRKLREKDEEIRRLRLVKRDLEKRVCASTVNERQAAGRASMSSSRMQNLFIDIEKQRMPPPPNPCGNSFRDPYPCMDDRTWREFREPNNFSASSCSDYDSFSAKSMPIFRPDQNPMQRSLSSRSLLFDHDASRYSQKPRKSYNVLNSSHCLHRGASCLSVCKFVPQEEDFPGPPAMYDKPLSGGGDQRISNAFENISDLNYKCDLDASCASSRRGRSEGLGGLGLGDDEEAQFMNPKNLEDLKNDGPSSPTDPNRGSELKQRNSQVPPHLQSSYPVETQNGKIPVTPLLRKKRFQ